MTLLLPGGAAPPVHRIAHALRLRANNSAFLSRTPAVASSQTTATLSVWVKRGSLGSDQAIFSAGTDGNRLMVLFDSSGALRQDDSGVIRFVTADRFRDPTAHLHLVWRVDTTEATSGNRIRFYVNNRLVTSFSTNAGMPGQNANLPHINTAVLHTIGRDSAGGRHFDGLMSDFHFVGGQSLDPSAFGRVDPATGAWVPRRYAGTYGANGFHLPFNDATSTTTIGQDRSGNGNNWTASGISVAAGVTFDRMIDTPTNNHATLNPLDNSGATLSSGNLETTFSSVNWASTACSIAIEPGQKIYAEARFQYGTGNFVFGVVRGHALPSPYAGGSSNGWGVAASNGGDVSTHHNGVQTNLVFTGASGDIYRVALDAASGNLWIGRNASWIGGGDPASNASPTYSGLSTTEFHKLVVSCYWMGGGAAVQFNAGQRPFAQSQPAGFSSLCAANLPTPTIARGDDAFYAGLRAGTGAAANVTGLRFKPGVVAIKSRGNAANYNAYDEVRGSFRGIELNTTNWDHNDGNTLTGFNADGFSLGNDANARGLNINTHAHVDWAWRRGAAYGVDVVTWTGNGANRTIGHGLNAVPQMIWVKALNAGTGWYVYHHLMATPAQNVFHFLNGGTSAGPTWDGTVWNNTAPTSGAFSLGTNTGVNGNGTSFFALLFAPVPGFSAFPKYTGGGGSDGAFLYLGFRPRWFLNKNIGGAAANWFQFDAAREAANPLVNRLFLNGNGAESGGNALDFVASGVKFRAGDPNYNGNATEYVCAAFAETPFKFANAR